MSRLKAFALGAARAFDIGSTINKRENYYLPERLRSNSGFAADGKALASDWGKVGYAIKSAMNSFEGEYEAAKKPR